jgi:hypothetical protein
MAEYSASTNVNEVIAKLQRYQADLLAIVRKPLEDGGLRVEGGMKPYPAPPPNSTYVRGAPPRSEKLGSRWTSRSISGPGWVGREVGNNASYGPWVQSRELQARVHQGRWQTDEDVIREALPLTVRDVERALVDAAGRQGA